MKDLQKRIENYADLILGRGVALQRDQYLVIETSVTTYEFMRILVKKAYEMGAKDVIIHYSDHSLTKARLDHASMEVLQETPDWYVQSRVLYGQRGACFLRLYNDDPDGLAGVDGKRLAAWRKAVNDPLAELNFKKKENELQWSASVVPGEAWAKKVYPEASAQEAVEKLWEAILDCCYVTEESGTDGWDAHVAEMQKNVKKLNGMKLRSLHFKNGTGTDLTMDICQGGIFAGGICHCPEPDGIMFAPNIPSEEILTTPHRFSVNGTVHNAKPMCYQGNIVDHFKLTFRDGVVTDYEAEVGEEVLKGILETDEGSRRLGEVALVPFDSPINQKSVIFFDTLFDENASCHLAFGAGYTDVMLGEDRSPEALESQGLNRSSLHADFMFGTADMDCTGTCQDGSTVEIFRSGRFVI